MGDSSRAALLKTVGAYALMEKFSDGYLGPVFKSYDRERDRAVEIRVFCEGIQWDDDLKSQLRRECAPLTRLEHPQIASLLSLHTEGRIPFAVMEPVGSRNLRSFLDRKRGMSFESKISIMMQVARGLAFAHGRGVIHQDICPENIFVRADGSVRVRDFAIAHFLRKHLPHPGIRFGAPIYLSPEQIQHREASERSDIFAAGVVFCELLTGSHPFFDPDSNKMLDNILNNRPHFTFEQHPHYHPRIRHIVKRCLAKEQAERYPDAGELLAAFQSMCKETSEDIQLMLSELQASFASLKAASERPNASKQCCRLSRSVWNILRGTENPDYELLDALMTDLGDIYPEILARAAGESVTEDELQPRIRSEDLHVTPDRATAAEKGEGEAAPCPSSIAEGSENNGPDASLDPKSTDPESCREAPPPHVASAAGRNKESLPGGEDGSGTLEAMATADSGRSVSTDSEEKNEPLNAASSNDAAAGSVAYKESPPVVGKTSRKRRFPRVPRPGFRPFAALVLVLLVVAAVYAFQKDGREGTVFGSWLDLARDSWMSAKASMIKDTPAPDAAVDSTARLKFSVDNADSDYEARLLDSLEAGYSDDAQTNLAGEKMNQIRKLIREGDLSRAEGELDRMRRMFPHSPEVAALYEEYRSRMSSSVNVRASGDQAGSRAAGAADKGSKGQRPEQDPGGTGGSRGTGETPAASVYAPYRESGTAVTASSREIPDAGKEVKEAPRFAAEHGHGLLRGDCRGELLLSPAEVAYRTLSGEHDFSVPVKILKVKREGKNIELLFLKSSELFKSLELSSAGEALRFSRTWDSFKSFPEN